MTLPRRHTVRRVIVLAAVAVVLNCIIAWAGAYAAMLAAPPTGQIRAAWVGSLESGLSVAPGSNTVEGTTTIGRGAFGVYQRRGALASSTVLQWMLLSARLEEAPSSAPVPALGQLCDAVDPRYQGDFKRWAAALNPIPGAPMAILEADSFGFPMHSLAFWMHTDYELDRAVSYPSYVPRITIRGGINANSLTTYTTPRPALVLPLTPRWPEFLANTVFWTGLLWLTFGGAASLRGIYRRRQGRCPACGYNMRGLAPGTRCPECGNGMQLPPS